MPMWNRVFIALLMVVFALQPAPELSTISGGYAHAATNKSTAKKSAKVIKVNAKKTPKKKAKARQATRAIQQAPAPKYAELVVDANTGNVLLELNADELRHPASLTKMMTLYLLFEAIESGKVSMSTELPVSAKAAGAPPTNIFLNEGDEVPVRTAIYALIIRSANDVAMVVAEALGGSQAGFATMMNRKARELGMTRTQFFNPSGLPDDRQVTTAVDMARLGIALRRDFPDYYHYFSKESFSFAGRDYTSHNRLLGRYPGADGIKTGYIRASGFNLVTSVERGRTRLVGVVLGGRTGAARDQEMMDILDNTFLNLARNPTGRSITPKTKKAAAEPTASTSAATPAPATPAAAEPAPADPKQWGIQVGAYADEAQAKAALVQAQALASSHVQHAKEQISTVDRAGETFYRARLIGLDSSEAREACTTLSDANVQCMLIRME